MREDYPKRSVSLSRLLGRISELFEEQITPHEVWVRAEVSSFKNHGSGHLYFDLVEERNGSQIARCRAVIWRGNAEAIFLRSKINVAEHLEDGREILCLARAVYHPVFGLSLQISDVDPDFALGEVEKRRRECIARLHKEQLLHLNKQLHLPPVIQRLAIIAAEGSAGFADLIEQLSRNNYGYHFEWTHFKASVQGKGAANTILSAFHSIDPSEYDAIILIRGGGATLDLDVFNHYELNATLAQSKLPFIVGIGHETDRTVVDEWACISLKTPSAVGAWIVERAREFEIEVSTRYQSIMEYYRAFVERSKSLLNDRSQNIVRISREVQSAQRIALSEVSQQIGHQAERRLKRESESQRYRADHLGHEAKRIAENGKHALKLSVGNMDRFAKEILVRSTHNLNMTKELVEVYQPSNTLKRGYTLLRKEDQIVMKPEQLKAGEFIQIETASAWLESEIKKVTAKNG
ncbi:MAG: exodeoxyribonuclease VII large subunit [Bacteroidetes bacterium]|nr:MAG: exodeoxyribonuclease VII large subunit [Bacteroidota bacterium]